MGKTLVQVLRCENARFSLSLALPGVHLVRTVENRDDTELKSTTTMPFDTRSVFAYRDASGGEFLLVHFAKRESLMYSRLKLGMFFLTWLFCNSQAAHASSGLLPALPEPPVGTPPNCPEYLIGQIDGVYYYGTSNCADTFGFGQSNVSIPVPQCMGMNCGTPISLVGHPLELKVAADADPVPGWIAELEAKLTELQSAANSRPAGDGRRERLGRLIPFVQRTLAYLRSGESLTNKTAAKTRYDEQLANHQHSMQHIGLAGQDPQKFAINDLKINGAPKSAANTIFTPSGSYPSGVTVTSSRGAVLKVEVATGQFKYYQTFLVTVSSSNSARRIDMRVGVEVTDEGLTTTEDAEFSERGRFGHRVRTKTGRTPFLVNGFSDLEP